MRLSTNSQEKSAKSIVLKFADSLVGTRGVNGNIREFAGNVRMEQGDVNVKCDRAYQYLDENRVDLFGNVVITQKDLIMTTVRGTYNGNLKIAESNDGVKITDKKVVLTASTGIYSTARRVANFTGNVKIEDDSLIIYSDKIEYQKDSRVSHATGNVQIQGKQSDVILQSDTLDNYPNSKYTLAKGSPKLFQIDSTVSEYVDSTSLIMKKKVKYDTMSIKSDLMESIKIDSNEMYTFRHNVEIVRDNITAKSDSAFYYKKEGYLRLLGKPVVWYDKTQLFADSIIIYLPNMKLNRLDAYVNALAATMEDTLEISRISQIVGDKITISFVNDSINSIVSYGHAQSLYFLKSDSSREGVQRNLCDTLAINFESGEADNIVWLGAVQGEMFPENVIADPKQYYLQSFRWDKKKPKKLELIQKKRI